MQFPSYLLMVYVFTVRSDQYIKQEERRKLEKLRAEVRSKSTSSCLPKKTDAFRSDGEEES